MNKDAERVIMKPFGGNVISSRHAFFPLGSGRSLLIYAGLLLMMAPANGQNSSGAALLTKENIVDVARRSAAWMAGVAGQGLAIQDRVRTGELSRATVRLTDLSVLRMNELTSIEILPPEKLGRSEGIDIKSGAMYFFGRERPRELRITTPVATGALRGTEFHVAVAATCKYPLADKSGSTIRAPHWRLRGAAPWRDSSIASERGQVQADSRD